MSDVNRLERSRYLSVKIESCFVHQTIGSSAAKDCLHFTKHRFDGVGLWRVAGVEDARDVKLITALFDLVAAVYWKAVHEDSKWPSTVFSSHSLQVHNKVIGSHCLLVYSRVVDTILFADCSDHRSVSLVDVHLVYSEVTVPGGPFSLHQAELRKVYFIQVQGQPLLCLCLL